LVELIMRLQAELARLQLRLAEVERGEHAGLALEQRLATPTVETPREAVLTSRDIEEHRHMLRTRRRRPWYRKVAKAIVPQNPRLGGLVVAIIVGVLVMSAAAALLLSTTAGGGWRLR
jgi:hypothetical protein